MAARTVVNREDPAGHLACGAPEDEYDPVVEELIKWREAVTADQVMAVFLRLLGDEVAMPSEMAEGIGDGINQARALHLPR